MDQITRLIPTHVMGGCHVAGHACLDLGHRHVNAITNNLRQVDHPAGFVGLGRVWAVHRHVPTLIVAGLYWDRR